MQYTDTHKHLIVTTKSTFTQSAQDTYLFRFLFENFCEWQTGFNILQLYHSYGMI